jgi:hypothetical protein
MDEDEAERIAEETYQQFKNDTDAEIERKRGVFRGQILQRENVEYNEARTKGINRVVHERQQAKTGREGRAEIREWINAGGKWWLAVPAGIGATFAVWKILASWFGA